MSAGADVPVDLVEVFSSAQGEGLDVGRSTLFVRLGGCDLRCAWCDSPGTWKPSPQGRIETARGSGVFEPHDNPVEAGAIVDALLHLEPERHAMVSLTGGEPLLQPDAVRALAARLGVLGPEVMLETHGLHVEGLRAVLDHLDVVSMDWKLASDVRRETDARGGTPAAFHDAHEAFLAVARAAPRVVVKVVVTQNSTDEEIDAAVARIARTHPSAALVLQPVTPFAAVRERPSAERLLALARRAERKIEDVRVVPQTHPLIGAL